MCTWHSETERKEGGKGRGKEGVKQGRKEERKQGRKGGRKEGHFFGKPSRNIKLPKSDEISLVSCFSALIVNARNLAVEEYLLIS